MKRSLDDQILDATLSALGEVLYVLKAYDDPVVELLEAAIIALNELGSKGRNNRKEVINNVLKAYDEYTEHREEQP